MKTVTIVLNADYAASILDAIGCAGIILENGALGAIDLNIPNWEQLQKGIFTIFSPSDLARAQAERHQAHEGEDLDALYDIFLEGYEELAAAFAGEIFPTPTLLN